MNDQLNIPDYSQEIILPIIAETSSGVVYDPRQEKWSFRDGVTDVLIDFKSIFEVSPELINSEKLVLIWMLKLKSTRHAMNMHKLFQNFVTDIYKQKNLSVTSIRDVDLINYQSNLPKERSWYLSSLAGFFRKWYSLGYPGVTKEAINFLNNIRLPGNIKGEAVRTKNTYDGPLTELETISIMNALADGYKNKKIDMEEYLLVWVFICIGMRPVQYAAMKICDVIEMDSIYSLNIPRAKVRSAITPRDYFISRRILDDVGRLFKIHTLHIKNRLHGRLQNIDNAPLFPELDQADWAVGFEFHTTGKKLNERLARVLGRLKVTSERTGTQIHINSRRFRRTIGTRAAEEGYGVYVIAEILGHTDIQNVSVYTEATNAFIERLDRAMAFDLAPLAQAFSGKLIRDESEASRGNDPKSRIIDFRIDRSGAPMGSCGQDSYCGFIAPIACYTCVCFEPWLDGPHEAVLQWLLDKRDRMKQTCDKRIVAINDRSIIAVAGVLVQIEEQSKSKNKIGTVI